MSLLLLVAIACVGSVASQVNVPCYGEGCANVTVYLGPRWGSRVITVPKTNKTRPESAVPEGEVEISGDRYNGYNDKYHRPQHRPVSPDEKTQIDFSDEESPLETTQYPFPINRNTYYKSNIRWPWWTMTTRRPSYYHRTVPSNLLDKEVRVVVDKFGRGTVDLSWRGYTGDDVKQVLLSLPENSRKQVTNLILDGNKISYLPVLVFPVEFEYGLQELSLNDNPISPPYLTSYTRFELSRLGNLRTLNMSRCGLRSIDMPELPSLEVLDLSYNKLTYLPPSLGRLSNILQLFLRGNRLGFISPSPISSLTSLWVLDIGESGITEIWGEPLENINSLITLKIDNNYLKSLPRLNSERTRIVFLANNSLQCTCALMEWVGQPNIQIQDDFFESCEDRYSSIIPLRQLKTWPEWHQDLCLKDRWWGARAWYAFSVWYRRNPDIMNVIYKVVGVTLVVVVLVVLLRRRRTLLSKVKPRGIPYDVLDEQQVSAVSGSSLHA